MTGPARTSRTAADDGSRWAEARSILEGLPTGPAQQRLRRARRHRLLLVLGFVLGTGAVAVVITLLVLDRGSERRVPVPAWQVVTGYTLSGIGLLLTAVALVLQIRGLRRVRAWSSPMHALTWRQRRELLRQVRGREAVVPERIPLARHLADLLLEQRRALPVQAGMMLHFAGLWIADRGTFRLVTVGIFTLLLLVGALLFRRESRRARRFLEAHPAPAR